MADAITFEEAKGGPERISFEEAAGKIRFEDAAMPTPEQTIAAGIALPQGVTGAVLKTLTRGALTEGADDTSLAQMTAAMSQTPGYGPMQGGKVIPFDPGEAMRPYFPLPRVRGKTLLGKLAAAPVNVAESLVEGVESPLGPFLLPLGAAGRVGQAALGVGFGVPAAAQGLKDVYEGTATGDVQQAVEGGLNTLLGGAMTLGGVRGAVGAGKGEAVQTSEPAAEAAPAAAAATAAAPVLSAAAEASRAAEWDLLQRRLSVKQLDTLGAEHVDTLSALADRADKVNRQNFQAQLEQARVEAGQAAPEAAQAMRVPRGAPTHAAPPQQRVTDESVYQEALARQQAAVAAAEANLRSTVDRLEKGTNAEQVNEAAQSNGDVLNAEGTGNGEGTLPADEGGAGISPRGQGTDVRVSAQEAPTADVRDVASEEPAEGVLPPPSDQAGVENAVPGATGSDVLAGEGAETGIPGKTHSMAEAGGGATRILAPWEMSPEQRAAEGWIGPVYRGTHAGKTKPPEFFTADPEYAKAYSSVGGYSGSYLKHEPGKVSYDPTSKVESYYVRNPKVTTEVKPWGMQGEAVVYRTTEARKVPAAFSMAAGGAPPPGGGLRTTAPPPPRRVPPPTPVPAPAAGATVATQSHFARMRQSFQSMFSPQNIDLDAKRFSWILRENNAQAALDLVRSDARLGALRSYFDQTPVAKDYAYDPAQPLPHNYAVIDAMERNRAALDPKLQDWARAMDQEFAWRIGEVQKLKPGAMQQLIANYFPHLWEQPASGAVRGMLAETAARSPFHGSKAFLKERTLPLTVDGLARGLRPISDNPVDLALAKLHQMDKFLMAAKTMAEAKGNGMLKYYPLGRKIPLGRSVVEDPAFTVYAPPVLNVAEAFDAGIRKGLMDFIGKIGFRHERVAKLGVNEWGQYTTGSGEIKSRFGGPDFVIMHEIGHGLEERYGISKDLLATPALKGQMAALADLRSQGVAASKKFRTYARTTDEMVANAVHAYLYAPEAMGKVAPDVQRVMYQLTQKFPELGDLNDIKPGLAVGSSRMDLGLPGPVLAGRWTLPDGAAAVLHNYLSPGLMKWAPFRTLRAGSNILNAAQLGLSAFHVGFTSLDAVVSSVATGLGYALRGELGKATRSLGLAPLAPVANYYLGKAVQGKMVNPLASSVSILDFPRLGVKGLQYRFSPAGEAALKHVAELAVKGGLRAELDPFWKTTITRNLVRAVAEGGLKNYARAGLAAPFALVEQSVRPIAEFLVPRQKLGVFAQLAHAEMDRLGPGAPSEQVRGGMARAADATEDRMGQMTYDNLFYNRAVKDLALMGFRAYGWQLGKYRHMFGAGVDAARMVKGIATGQPVEVTNRMLYPVALTMVAGLAGGLVHYALTGKRPEELTDYMFPQNGQVGPDGRPQRLMLPTYLKDVVSDWKDAPDVQKMGASFYHKLNPWVAQAVDMYRNQDFYGVEIRHPDDPAVKQAGDLALYAAKQFRPFSITGTLKLAQDESPAAQLVLPFFGIVPAKKSLTMTPAQTLAADIARAALPSGARTQESADHSALLREIVKDMKKNPGMAPKLVAAASAGQLKATDTQTINSLLTLTPLQYQAQKMQPGDAMRVWRLANPAERQELQAQLVQKMSNAKALDDAKRTAYLQELVR